MMNYHARHMDSDVLYINYDANYTDDNDENSFFNIKKSYV